MKEHIITALREQLDRWEALLVNLEDEEIEQPLQPSEWTVKDVMAHLKAWQARTIARCAAAVEDVEPDYPQWPDGMSPDEEGSTERLNAWIYEIHRGLGWKQVYQDWRAGYRRFIALAEQVAERDLLDSSRYAWLNGYPLADILLASYDHHQEHYEKLLAWLQDHGAALNEA